MRRPLVLCVAAMLAACGSSGPVVDWQPSQTAVWHTASPGLLIEARIAIDAGNIQTARLRLARILSATPELLTARFMQQELALIRPDADRTELAALARARASASGASPVEALLAARLEPDSEAARLLIEGALVMGKSDDLEAACRYALAHIALARDDTASARRELDRSLALDPGAAKARRLEARLEAASGRPERTEALLSHWTDAVEWAPEVRGDEWYATLVELAVVRAGLDDPEGAMEALERFFAGRGAGGVWSFPLPGPTPRANALFTVAALKAEQADVFGALEKVREARELVSPHSRAGRLAMVDEALLAELFLDRPLDAADAWLKVLERFDEAGAEVDFDELLRALEARIRLARLEAAASE